MTDDPLQEQIQSCMVQRQNLESIFDAVADAVIAADLDLRIMQLNRAATGLTGLTRDTATGVSCLQGLSLDEDSTLARLLQERRETQGLGVELTAADGGVQQLLATTRLLSDEAGTARGIVLILRDVTELHNMRQHLAGDGSFHGLVGRHQSMRAVFDLVEQLADSEATVLVLGESGTGKELVASAIHHCSQRRDGPFIKVNCSALSENLLESELFGHVRGAFTGAVRDKVGRFEQAAGGTIFLDEIGDLTPQVQVKLLRVLQEREIERVGSGRTIPVDCRVVAATHRDLREAIAAGTFREDLFYRLNVMPVLLPPLRDRREDIPLLVDHFVSYFRQRTGRPIHAVHEQAMDRLLQHPWPGNVRELLNAIEHAFVRCRGEVLIDSCLPASVSGGAVASAEPVAAPQGPASGDEKEQIRGVLRSCRWNRHEAAQRLGMHRTTLWRKMKEYGL